MKMLGYESCMADPDLWVQEASKSNDDRYYVYVLLYVDDLPCCSEFLKEAIIEIDECFPLKKGSVGTPSNYLGSNVGKVQLPYGADASSWSMSQYVQSSIDEVERNLKARVEKLPTKNRLPMSSNYYPELDSSHELSADDANYYQSFVGILCWIIEMGRMDICTRVSMLSSSVVCPREVHFNALLQIFSYLKSHHNAGIVFDPSYPDVDESFNEKWDLSNFYGNDHEPLPGNELEPLGKNFVIRAYVDAFYAGCKLTRRSRTGLIVYLNAAKIYWYSKKQGSWEISTFAS